MPRKNKPAKPTEKIENRMNREITKEVSIISDGIAVISFCMKKNKGSS